MLVRDRFVSRLFFGLIVLGILPCDAGAKDAVLVEKIQVENEMRVNVQAYGVPAIDTLDELVAIAGISLSADRPTTMHLIKTPLSVSLDSVALEDAISLICGAVNCVGRLDGKKLVVRQFDFAGDELREQAILLYRNVLLLFPRSPLAVEARFTLAQLLAQGDIPAAAADAFVGFARDFPRDEKATKALLLAAKIQGDLDNNPGLRELTFKIIESYPRSPEIMDACRLTVNSFIADGELQAAERSVKLFARRFGENHHLAISRWMLGNAYQEQGLHREAIEVYASVVRTKLLTSKELNQLAMANLESRFAMGRIEECAEILARELKAANPFVREPRWQLLASEIYLESEMPLFALMLAREMMAGSPTDSLRNQFAFVAARGYLDLGLPGRTRELITTEIDDLNAPGRGKLALECAGLLMRRGRDLDAEQLFVRLQVLPEFRSEARLGMAQIRFGEDEFEICLSMLHTLVAEDGDVELKARRLAADCYIAMGRRRRAIEVLEGASWGQG